MPDFTLACSPITAGCLSTPQWIDLPSTNPPAPSRLNPQPLSPPRYRKVQAPTLGGSVTIQIAAVVAGVVGPSDGALGGVDLFSWAWTEFSGQAPAAIIPTSGFSSIIRVTWLNTTVVSHMGHHLLSCRRPNHGAQIIPFDVEA